MNSATKNSLSYASQIIETFHFRAVDLDQIPDTPMVYMVVQGENIITIGESQNSKRLRSLITGSGTHNKKPLVSLCAKLYPALALNFFHIPAVDKKSAKELEAKVHNYLGTKLNQKSESTYIDGQIGYARSLRYLLKAFHDESKWSDRHKDLVELVEKDGDIFGHALSCERMKDLAVELFGDFYNRSSSSDGGSRKHSHTTNPIALVGGWIETESHYFRFKNTDFVRLKSGNFTGWKLKIRDPGSRWKDGELDLEVPYSENGAGWRILQGLADSPSFRKAGERTDSSQIPGALRSYIRKPRS